MRCLHCNKKIGKARARGLCPGCHREPDVRALYPPIAPQGNRQRGLGCAQPDQIDDPPLPPAPTDTLPQTPARVEVMRQRDSDGFHVHHPGDNGSVVRGQEDLERPAPMWRAILPSGVVVAGIFAPTKSEARSEVKKRLRLDKLPSGTRVEQVNPERNGSTDDTDDTDQKSVKSVSSVDPLSVDSLPEQGE